MEYEAWVEQYKPVTNTLDPHAGIDGYMFETFGAEHEFIRQHRLATNDQTVWTLVEGDNGEWIISSGYHFVNRLGYFITQEPWTDACMEVMYADTDEEEEALG